MAIQASGRFQRIKKPLKSDMNVVPYIDVMLVLLVIFMVDAPTIVTLKEDGSYYLEYKNQATGPVTLEELTRTLVDAQTQAQNDNKVLNVVINGHNTRPYGDVMALMSSLQDAGLSQVGLLTKPLE